MPPAHPTHAKVLTSFQWSTAPLCKRQKRYTSGLCWQEEALAGASRQPCLAIKRGDGVRRYLARRTVIVFKRDLKAIQWGEVSRSAGTGELRGAKDEGDQRASHQKLSRTSAQAVAKPQRRRLGSAAHAGCEGGHGRQGGAQAGAQRARPRTVLCAAFQPAARRVARPLLLAQEKTVQASFNGHSDARTPAQKRGCRACLPAAAGKGGHARRSS